MTWTDFVADCARRHGVGSSRWAEQVGIPAHVFIRRTGREKWAAPYPKVRILPAFASVGDARTSLVAYTASTTALAAASGGSALWLHGLLAEPPTQAQLVAGVGHHVKATDQLRVRRARWLAPSDIVEVDEVPTLTLEPALLTVCHWPAYQLKGLVLDRLQRELLTLDALWERLDGVGPVAGLGDLRRLVAGLRRYQSESVFDDELRHELAHRGYHPPRGPVDIDTPDGRGLKPDILVGPVAVEAEGDLYHRSRDQRLKDRRRYTQYAGTDLVVVPVDWFDWQQDRESVFAAIDAALLAQRRRGIGLDHPLPPHLADKTP